MAFISATTRSELVRFSRRQSTRIQQNADRLTTSTYHHTIAWAQQTPLDLTNEPSSAYSAMLAAHISGTHTNGHSANAPRQTSPVEPPMGCCSGLRRWISFVHVTGVGLPLSGPRRECMRDAPGIGHPRQPQRRFRGFAAQKRGCMDNPRGPRTV